MGKKKKNYIGIVKKKENIVEKKKNYIMIEVT